MSLYGSRICTGLRSGSFEGSVVAGPGTAGNGSGSGGVLFLADQSSYVCRLFSFMFNFEGPSTSLAGNKASSPDTKNVG